MDADIDAARRTAHIQVELLSALPTVQDHLSCAGLSTHERMEVEQHDAGRPFTGRVIETARTLLDERIFSQ